MEKKEDACFVVFELTTKPQKTLWIIKDSDPGFVSKVLSLKFIYVLLWIPVRIPLSSNRTGSSPIALHESRGRGSRTYYFLKPNIPFKLDY